MCIVLGSLCQVSLMLLCLYLYGVVIDDKSIHIQKESDGNDMLFQKVKRKPQPNKAKSKPKITRVKKRFKVWACVNLFICV